MPIYYDKIANLGLCWLIYLIVNDLSFTGPSKWHQLHTPSIGNNIKCQYHT